MKLHLAVLLLTFTGIICVVWNDYCFDIKVLEQKSSKLQRDFTSKYFIAESFKKTCNGKGFENLEQWLKYCSAMFRLRSISYEKRETVFSGQYLFYAKWSGVNESDEVSGEVYFFKNE